MIGLAPGASRIYNPRYARGLGLPILDIPVTFGTPMPLGITEALTAAAPAASDPTMEGVARGSDGLLHLTERGRAIVLKYADEAAKSVAGGRTNLVRYLSPLAAAAGLDLSFDPSAKSVKEQELRDAEGLYECTVAGRLRDLFVLAAKEGEQWVGSAIRPSADVLARARSATTAYQHSAGEGSCPQAHNDVQALGPFCPALTEAWALVMRKEAATMGPSGTSVLRTGLDSWWSTTAPERWAEAKKYAASAGILAGIALVLVGLNIVLPKN